MAKPEIPSDVERERLALKITSNKMSAALLRAGTSLRRMARERERRSRHKAKQPTKT